MKIFTYFKENILIKIIKILIIIFILTISFGCTHSQDENCDSKGCEVKANQVFEFL